MSRPGESDYGTVARTYSSRSRPSRLEARAARGQRSAQAAAMTARQFERLYDDLQVLPGGVRNPSFDLGQGLLGSRERRRTRPARERLHVEAAAARLEAVARIPLHQSSSTAAGGCPSCPRCRSLLAAFNDCVRLEQLRRVSRTWAVGEGVELRRRLPRDPRSAVIEQAVPPRAAPPRPEIPCRRSSVSGPIPLLQQDRRGEVGAGAVSTTVSASSTATIREQDADSARAAQEHAVDERLAEHGEVRLSPGRDRGRRTPCSSGPHRRTFARGVRDSDRFRRRSPGQRGAGSRQAAAAATRDAL